MAHLYCITSPSGKQYIGIAKNMNKRWSVHVSEAMSGSKTALHNAIRKYGKESFNKKILVIGVYEYIKNLEISAISKFKTKSPKGYNLTIGGDGTIGFKHRAESKEIMRKVTAKRMEDSNARNHLRALNLGKKHSEESNLKKSLSTKQRHAKNPHPMLGKKHSEETKKKISNSLIGNSRTKGHKLTDEHKQKLSKAMKGRKFSDETLLKMRNAQLGKKYSAEVRARMSAAAKLREQRKREKIYEAV